MMKKKCKCKHEDEDEKEMMDEEEDMKESMKLGGGGRFKQLTKKLSSKGAYNPKALAAWIGRKKLGKKKFQKLAAKGK